MDPMKVAWLAGLLEGEGTFLLATSRPGNGKGEYRYPYVVLTMTDRDVVARAGKLLGCKVQRIEPSGVSKKIAYRITVRGSKAVALMEAVRPLMGKRRGERIDELLAYEDDRPDPAVARSAWSKAAMGRRVRGEDGRFVTA